MNLSAQLMIKLMNISSNNFRIMLLLWLFISEDLKMGGCVKISIGTAIIRVRLYHCYKLKMEIASLVLLIRAGHRLKMMSGSLTLVLFSSIWLEKYLFHAYNTGELSNAANIKDLSLDCPNFQSHLKNSINQMHVNHGQIKMVTKSH